MCVFRVAERLGPALAVTEELAPTFLLATVMQVTALKQFPSQSVCQRMINTKNGTFTGRRSVCFAFERGESGFFFFIYLFFCLAAPVLVDSVVAVSALSSLLEFV